MKLILEAIKSLLRSLKNSIHVTQKAVADVDAKANSAKEAAYYAEDVANEAYGRAINAQETASNAQTTASNAQAAVEDKLDNLNPSGTGVFSMNRKANTTIGSRSTAMGNTTTASGTYATAMGNTTTASGTYATAMGDTTTSSGRSSTAMGNTTTASGNYSIAMGNTTKAQRRSQHVQGEFNLLDTYGSTSTRGKYAHIVGNGTSDTARSNAHTLDWNGLGWFAGGLKVGGTSQDDANAKEVATKGDKLPNPNALTFTGAVEGTYDGSAPMEIEIPEGGAGGIVFEDSYVSNANNWVTNGYTKTGRGTTINLPYVFDDASKWGVLFYIAENGTTGTQMLYPIDGTYKGTIWTRACVKQSFSPWKQLLTSDAISNGVRNPNAITFTGSSVGTYDGSAPLTINIPAGLSDDGSLQIPVATETTLGGVKASAKTEDMTQPVGIGEDGYLFTASGIGNRFRLIQNITIDHDNIPQYIEVTQDMDGNPFKTRKLAIETDIVTNVSYCSIGINSGGGANGLRMHNGYQKAYIFTGNEVATVLSSVGANSMFVYKGNALVPNDYWEDITSIRIPGGYEITKGTFLRVWEVLD